MAPIVDFYTIEVSMAYPGANPEEIEESIVIKIEDQVSGLADVNAVRSVAAPGMASVRIEMNSGADMDQALGDVESAVSRIQTFPAGAERPVVREMTSNQSIIRMILYGDMAERSLKELAHRIEDEITALPEVSLAEVSGIREYEISIEVPGQRLRALGLTLDDIANVVRANSLDLSAGSIDTSEAQVRVRTLGQRYVQQEFEDIVLVAQDDGSVLRLGDIATVRDEFQDIDIIVRHRNQPAVFIEVYRSENERVMNVATAVHEHLAGAIEPSLPEGVGISIWNDESGAYSERADLLLKNGSLGCAGIHRAGAVPADQAGDLGQRGSGHEFYRCARGHVAVRCRPPRGFPVRLRAGDRHHRRRRHRDGGQHLQGAQTGIARRSRGDSRNAQDQDPLTFAC